MFKTGFEKVALDWKGLGTQALSLAKNKTVQRNALVGAGVGGAVGAASDKDSRVGGAMKGALLGGLTGGLGTMAYKGGRAKFKSMKTTPPPAPTK